MNRILNYWTSLCKASTLLTAIALLETPSFSQAPSTPIEIEPVQRDLQSRYFFINGTYAGWLSCQCGTPAPHYPKNGFYGDMDLAFARDLVANLTGNFQTALGIAFLKSDDGDLDGKASLTHYVAEDFPRTGPGFDLDNVTTNNFRACFDQVRKYVAKLKYVGGGADSTSGSDGNNWRYGEDVGTNCPDTKTLVRGEYDAFGWQNSSAGGTIHVTTIGWATTNTPPDDIQYHVKLETAKGRIGASVGSSLHITTTAKLKFYLAVSTYTAGKGANDPPVTADGLFHHFDSDQNVSGPGDYYSRDLAAEISNPTTCDGGVQGWQVNSTAYVIEPDFNPPVDPVSCADGGCSSGGCQLIAAAPGSSDVTLASLDLRVNLGPDQYGSPAGYFYFHADSPSASLYTPAALQYAVKPGVLVYLDNGAVSQAVSYNLTATVQPSAAGYGIHFTNNLSGAFVSSVTIESNGTPNQLIMTEVLGSNGSPRVVVCTYTTNSGTAAWTRTEGSGVRAESLSTVWTTPSNRTDTIVVSNAAIASVITNQYRVFPWGQTLIQQTLGSGSSPKTSSWTYYEDPSTNGYGQRALAIGPTGHWEKYQYGPGGSLTNKIVQLGNNGTGTPDNANREIQISYDDTNLVTTTVEKLLGSEISRTYVVTLLNDDEHWERIATIRCATPGAAINAADNLTNILWRATDTTLTGTAWDTLAELNPDGTMAVYSYATPGNKVVTVSNGVPNAAWAACASATPTTWPNIVDGTASVTETGLWGELVSRTVIDIASGLVTDREMYDGYDGLKRSHTVHHQDGTTEAVTYACCGLTSSIDRDGVTTDYSFDAARRQTASKRLNIMTTNVLDAAGRPLQTIRIGSDSSQIQLHGAAYNTDGSLLRETNALNGVTSYSETFGGTSPRVRTITYPDNGTRIETYNQDGSLQKVTGTAAFPVRYDYGVLTDGGVSRSYVAAVKLNGAGADSSECSTNLTDALGRPYKAIYAAASGTKPFALSTYNRIGQMTNQIDPDGVISLFVYNNKGERTLSILNSNRDYSVSASAAGNRITAVTNDVIQLSGTWDNAIVRRSRTYQYSETGPVLVNESWSATNGIRTASISFGLTSETRTIYGGSGTRYVTNTAPDNSYTVSAYQDGRLTSVARKAGSDQLSSVSYSYDPHGRAYQATDARTGTTTYGFNNADQVASTTTPSPTQVTTNAFDNLGRVIRTKLPDNTYVTNKYAATGLLTNTFGSRTYPVGYTYDSQGRVKTMNTWKNYAGGFGAATTTWNYDLYRGWLTNKTYHGGAAGPKYTYTAAGRLATRVWARGVTTTYSYGGAGDLVGVSYSDGTASLGYSYDRRGRQATITQGSATTSRSYDNPGNMLSESYAGGPLDSLSVVNIYDSLFRRVTNGVKSGSTWLTQTRFGYDAASRLQTVISGTNSATYAYLANSPLVSQIAFTNGTFQRMVTSKTYDNLNRLTSISSVPSVSSAVSSSYSHNSANQRTSVTNADNAHWAYQYDSLGQVVSGKKYFSDGTPVAGEQFEYSFDDIGNRTTEKFGGDAGGANLRYESFANNSLNQLTARDVPGYANILGEAATNAYVTVNNQPAYRRGEFFRKELAIGNGSSAIYQAVTNLAAFHTATNDIVVTNAGNIFLPQNPESLAYDADGNLTNDGRWTVTWDGENRAVSFTSLGSSPSASKTKIDCTYDSQWRRTQKIVSTWNGSSYVPQSTNRFVYDGWNLIATLTSDLRLQTSFAWGLDLSGSLQGAGGVAGLLAIGDSTQGIHFVAFDGNGNVSALLNATTGITSAQYEYGPFGELLRATGPMAFTNPVRFSTKYQDEESGLRYYGFRFYDSGSGKWLSRDPFAEKGGLNLSEFSRNNPVCYFDSDGRFVQAGVAALTTATATTGGANATTTITIVGAGTTAGGSLSAAPVVAGVTALAASTAAAALIIAIVEYPPSPIVYPSPTTPYNPNPYNPVPITITLPQPQPDPRPPLPPVTPLPPTQKQCKCMFLRVPPLGGDTAHNAYAASLQGGVSLDLMVITPDGLSATFDAGVPLGIPKTVYEAKTGHEFMNNPSTSTTILEDRRTQFERESTVAKVCNLQFIIAVDNADGAEGLRFQFPSYDIRYIPGP